MVSDHAADGTDEAGQDLVLTIRIGPDGRLYFHDLTPDLLGVALAMCPRNPEVRRRVQMACLFEEEPA